MKPSEIIRDGRIALFERGWCQFALEDEAGAVCALGALNLAENGDARSRLMSDAQVGACKALRVASPTADDPVFYNNAPERTFNDIVEWFDKAEKLAEQAEALDA